MKYIKKTRDDNRSKSRFFKFSLKIYKSLARSTKGKRERKEMERGDSNEYNQNWKKKVTTSEMQRIIRDYRELYVNTL